MPTTTYCDASTQRARDLIQPHIQIDGFYILRPSTDPHGSVLCTICVTNKQKLVNYRLVRDKSPKSYYIHVHTKFSDIRQLLEHYSHNPINADANTRLLYPITPAQETDSLDGKVLNFKINFQNNEYFIASRHRFKTIQAFLAAYHKHPLKSKRTGNEKVFLRAPIPVDPNLEKRFKQMMENEVGTRAKAQPEPLPEPWQEHFHAEYQRAYYYNPTTGVSVWERPRPSNQPQRAKTMPPGVSSPRRQNRIQSRPLPVPPGSEAEKNPPLSEQRPPESSSPLGRRKQLPPPTRQSSETARQQPNRRATATRALPPLPPKDDEEAISPFRSLPPLPPKEETDGGRRETAPPQLPQRGNSSRELRGRAMPPLPPKEPDTGAAMTSIRGRPLPQLPSISERELPPLPPKDDRPLPPLPPKNDEVSPSPPVPSPGTGRREKKKKAAVKCNDNTMFNGRHEDEGIAPSDGPAPVSLQDLPPLPEKISPTAPPPPPVASDIPAPPPLPPQASPSQLAPPPPPPPPQVLPPPPPQPPPPPSPNPSTERLRQTKQKPPNESMQNGRPFTANDLQAAKTLLRAAAPKDSPDSPDFRRHTLGHRGGGGGGGLADVFASAIDTRMVSIRKATQDSDESEFEDVDDDEEWSD